MAKKIGVMVFGHGSRSGAAVEEFKALAVGLTQRFSEYAVDYGFLEFARPVIRDGLDSLREQGVDHILAVPGMLFAAGHVKNDIVSVLNDYAAQYPVKIEFARDLGIDPNMLAAASERIKASEAAAGDGVTRNQTLLMVVGRGTSDPDANGNVAKIARMLGEGMGFGWTEVCYSGVTFPLVTPGLEHAVKLGYRRIIVFPYFLFTGVLVERIYAATDRVAAENPGVEFIKAGYLSDHPRVIDTFVNRVRGIATGDNNMNCLTCKYREQVVGFETDVGAPQEGHHHHAEGVGAGGGHDHAHAHTSHPHAEHPHSPGRRDPNEP
jgi:sirohydrochlorin cobaltochelatase